MTHAESQDLLVDLAFGELDPARAAEVESHLAGCEECRKEKVALEEARRMAAPLRELEEPSPGFDDRVLEVARTQAQLDHDGNVGQVIEVSGNVRPLGVDAARIDAHGPVKVRPVERKRPRWVLRAALGGSVAMAAALALVVSTTLETRRSAEQASRAQADDYRIHVKPAVPEAVDSALRDRTTRELGKEGPGALPPEQSARPAEKKQEEVAETRPTVKRPAAGPAGGVVGGTVVSGKADAPAVEEKDKLPAAPPARHAPVPKEIAIAPLQDGYAPADEAAGSRVRRDNAPQATAKRSAAPAAGAEPTVPASVPAEPAANAAAAKVKAQKEVAAAPEDASTIEAGAQQARHAGDYVKAAALYRSAADARRRADDAGAAAWNLAHAVECLAAVGQFDEARRVREELTRLYPEETTALSAARRALREVDVPGALPASKQR